jgi:hypothetical protein
MSYDATRAVRGLVAAVLLLGLVLSAAVVAADQVVVGQVELVTSSPDGDFEAQAPGTLTVTVTNNAEVQMGGPVAYEEEVKTVRNIRVRVLENRIEPPIDVQAGTQTIGSLPGGGEAQLQFPVEVGSVEPGTYRVPIRVEYKNTRAVSYDPRTGSSDVERQNRDRKEVKYVTMTVSEEPEFEVVSEEANRIFAGDTGEFGFTIRNVGTEPAVDATVSLSTNTPGVFFGKRSSASPDSSVYVASLGVNETETFSVNVGARDDVSPGSYPITARVNYEGESGIAAQSEPLQAGLQVRPERSFALRNVTTTDVRVDEPEAEIRARLVNEGPAPARNVVARLQGMGGVTITNGETAVGDLGVGESAPVSFTVSVPDEATPGSRSFDVGVEYENADGDLRGLSTPLRRSLTVEPERELFEVVDTNTSVTPGATETLSVTVAYRGDEPVRNANVKLFTSDPLSSSDDGAYLGSMEPGETTTAQFTVSASSDALAKLYDSSVEVRYEEPDGDTRFSGTLTVGVPVSEAESGGFPLLPAVAVALLVLGGVGTVVYRRI